MPLDINMNRTLNHKARRLRKRGSAMLEYSIIVLALTVALFVATPAGQLLADAIRKFYANLTFYISLP